MNESTIESNDPQSPSAFLPLALVEFSLILILIFQGLEQSSQRSKLQEATKQREAVVAQSTEVQGKLQKLIEEFNAATPEEAKTIFTKYGIQFTPKSAASPIAPAK